VLRSPLGFALRSPRWASGTAHRRASRSARRRDTRSAPGLRAPLAADAPSAAALVADALGADALSDLPDSRSPGPPSPPGYACRSRASRSARRRASNSACSQAMRSARRWASRAARRWPSRSARRRALHSAPHRATRSARRWALRTTRRWASRPARGRVDFAHHSQPWTVFNTPGPADAATAELACCRHRCHPLSRLSLRFSPILPDLPFSRPSHAVQLGPLRS